jgi:NAD(P)-dependent dehydrogenase (short-subunit alcohol dehydrogenase family)
MKNKIVVITGATGGMGRVTAEALAKMGATVVILARNKTKAETTVQEIKSATGNANISFIEMDLDSLASVKKAADELKRRYEKIDVLINNAGVTLDKRQLTNDGFERTFQVNHLSHFLLTHLLLDQIKAAGKGRIINLSSGAQAMGKIDFSNLQGEKNYKGLNIYCNSKLMNVLFTYELAERLKGTGVTVNALHPGVVATDFGKGTSDGFIGFMVKYLRFMMISPDKGSQTAIYLASSPGIDGVTGKYFVKKKPAGTNKQSYDAELRKEFFETSREMVKNYL